MPTLRYRERDTSAASAVLVAVGALAGLAAGVLLAQRMGGLSGIQTRVRDRLATARGDVRDGDDAHPFAHDTPEYEDEPLAGTADARNATRSAAGRSSDARGSGGRSTQPQTTDDDGEALEERVLEAFRNDPILSERAVDIGAIGRGIIELTGWVHEEDETQHAVTITRGIPGVDTVVNRLTVREEEDRLNDTAQRYASGEAEHAARWEGQGVGIGRPRQGTSADVGRHADPKVNLEDRWQGRDKAIDEAADDLEGIAERRGRASIVGEPGSGEPESMDQSGRVTRAD